MALQELSASSPGMAARPQHGAAEGCPPFPDSEERLRCTTAERPQPGLIRLPWEAGLSSCCIAAMPVPGTQPRSWATRTARRMPAAWLALHSLVTTGLPQDHGVVWPHSPHQPWPSRWPTEPCYRPDASPVSSTWAGWRPGLAPGAQALPAGLAWPPWDRPGPQGPCPALPCPASQVMGLPARLPRANQKALPAGWLHTEVTNQFFQRTTYQKCKHTLH